jgi:hypothetical protein
MLHGLQIHAMISSVLLKTQAKIPFYIYFQDQYHESNVPILQTTVTNSLTIEFSQF